MPTTFAALAALATNAASSTSVDTTLTTAVPALAELAGARAAVVVRQAATGWMAAASVGPPLIEPIAVSISADTHAGAWSPVEVPAGWDGLTHAAVHGLPGAAGVLILGWADATATPSGELDVALAVLDVAVQRAQAGEALADLTARVNSAQQLANMGDYDWHIATDTNRWSDQLYRIYGHEPQSFNASYDRFLSHIHPDDRERIQSIHERAYATGEPYEMVERIVRPDGEVRFLASNGQVIQDADGNPVRMRGTCIDITDRVLAEQDRERSAARLRSLTESSPDAIVVVDAAGIIVQANGPARMLLGDRGGELVGSAIGAIVRPPVCTALAEPARALDGRDLALDITVTQFHDLDGSELTAAFVRDATPRLIAERSAARLREVEMRRRQALELNDTVVQGLTAAIYARSAGEDAMSTEYLDHTLAAARRMMNDWLHPLGGEPLHAGYLVRSAPADLGAAVDRPAEDARHRGAQTRVVLVDDNDDVRRLLRQQLERAEHLEVVGEACDGKEAITITDQTKPDVVILDLSMPQMDGLEALPHIRSAAPDAKVIVLSGFDQGMMAHRALAAGAARYVEKGSRLDLPAVVDEVLDEPVRLGGGAGGTHATGSALPVA